jgi:hypothetical protein
VPVKPNDKDVFLGPDDEPPNRSRKTAKRSVTRLRPLPGAFVRVPIQWLCKPGRRHALRARERVFLYLLFRSHWGQRSVTLTAAVAAEIGVTERTRRRALDQLERSGWVRVERQPGCALVARPIVLSA